MKTFTLPQIAEELEMSAKAARAILRKKGIKRPGTRWTWPMEKKAEIKAMLKGKPAPVKKTKAKTKVRGEVGAYAHH